MVEAAVAVSMLAYVYAFICKKKKKKTLKKKKEIKNLLIAIHTFFFLSDKNIFLLYQGHYKATLQQGHK